MKILKNGTVRLAPGERRAGNFVFTPEKGHVKVQDIAGMVSFRVSTAIAEGGFLQMMTEEGLGEWMQRVAVVTYNYLCTVPDARLFAEVNRACVDCVNRHRDIYGLREDIPQEDDDAILGEEREAVEARERIAEGLGKLSEDMKEKLDGMRKAEKDAKDAEGSD